MNIQIGDYYNLEEKTIISRKEENGYEDQFFEKEEIKWRVLNKDEENRELLLISDKPTNQEIILSGKAGYENAIKVLDKICEEITGRPKVRNLNKEDIEKSKYWEDEEGIKAKLIFGENDDYYYWLASRGVSFSSSYAYFRVFYVYCSSVHASYLYGSYDSVNGAGYAVRPVVIVKM